MAKRYLVEMQNGTKPNSYDFVGSDKTDNAREFIASDPSPNGGNDYSGSGDKIIVCRLLSNGKSNMCLMQITKKRNFIIF